MIYMRLKGGMGNQMFQYAFGIKLAHDLKTKLKLDLTSLLDRSKGDFVYRDYDLTAFNVDHEFMISPNLLRTFYKFKSRKLTKLITHQVSKNRGYIKEDHFHFQSELLQNPLDNAIYEGWWQSPKYFAGVEDKLREHFTFKNQPLSISDDLFNKIKTSNSICLNVRRTDFLKVDNLNTTSKTYFLNAANRMADLIDDPVFFIFSDDVKWCAENLKLDHPTHVVDHTHKGYKFTNYLQMMSSCKHFIIPNSSYAWWAIWLNKNEDNKVIAPKNWFNDQTINTTDLVPAHWMRM